MKILLVILGMLILSGCSTNIKYSEDTIHLNKSQFKKVFMDVWDKGYSAGIEASKCKRPVRTSGLALK